MDAYTLLQISEAVGVIFIGLGSTFYGRRAAKQSTKAVELSTPTGNGFAGKVKGDLTTLIEEMRDTRGEICTLKTDMTHRLDRLEDRLDRHMDAHSIIPPKER